MVMVTNTIIALSYACKMYPVCRQFCLVLVLYALSDFFKRENIGTSG